MKRVGPVAIAAALLLAAAALMAWHWQALGFTPISTALGLLAIVGVPSALWLILGQKPREPRRLPRIFWLGLLLLLFGLAAAQPWYTVTSFTHPVTIGVGQNVVTGANPTRLRRTVLPTKVGTAIRRTFPSLSVGEAWTVVGAPDAEYEIWLKRPGKTGFALQVLWQGGMIRIENQNLNSLYTPGTGREQPLATLKAMYRPGKGVQGPFVFPGYLLYVAPTAGEAWTVNRYTGGMGGGSGY